MHHSKEVNDRSQLFTFCTELSQNYHSVLDMKSLSLCIWQQNQRHPGINMDHICHRRMKVQVRILCLVFKNTKYQKQAMAITPGKAADLNLLICTAGKWTWTISVTSCKWQAKVCEELAAMISHWACAGHSQASCCQDLNIGLSQGLQKSKNLCSMSLLWKNLGSDLGCKLTSACSLQSADMEKLLNSCAASVTYMDHWGLSKQTALWLAPRWAVLAVSSSGRRNHKPIAHVWGEGQLTILWHRNKVIFKKKVFHWNCKTRRKREGNHRESKEVEKGRGNERFFLTHHSQIDLRIKINF